MMQKTSDIYPSIETIFIKVNGIDFEVDTQGNGDKLVLCLHGWPEHSIAWRFQIPFLADLGYKVWAPNLRGYGNTDAPKGMKNYHWVSHQTSDIGARKTRSISRRHPVADSGIWTITNTSIIGWHMVHTS